jgi:myosin-1
MEYPAFIDRYKMVSGITWPVWKGSQRDGASYIVKECKFPDDQVSYGRMKIFIQDPRSLWKLEELRREAQVKLATKLQAVWKGFLCRRVFKEQRNAACLIAAYVKGWKMRKWWQAKRAGAVLLQNYFRMWMEKRTIEEESVMHEKRKAAIIITATIKGYLVRKRYRKCFKKHAGPIMMRNLIAFQKRNWLREVAASLPTAEDPNTQILIRAPPSLTEGGSLISGFYQDWRCKAYRDKCPPKQQTKLREKYIASQIFKGKKASYGSPL